jgi:hypothetical protein
MRRRKVKSVRMAVIMIGNLNIGDEYGKSSIASPTADGSYR